MCRVYLFVFLSGLAALSWEVIWQIKSSLALGVSAWGAAITLGVTMGGMAAGALLTGSYLKKKPAIQPLRAYGILEIIIGLSGLSLIWTFNEIEHLDTLVYKSLGYSASSMFILGIISILGLPALCLGATLPVIGLAARQIGTSLSTLYALNTLGAALGCIIAACVFIPLFGVNSTIITIASINLIVGILAILSTSKASEVAQQDSVEIVSKNPLSYSTSLIIVCVTGFTTFILEIAWFRSFTAAFMSTTDAFAIMLASVLLGLGIGARLVSYIRKTNIQLGLLIAVAGILVLLTTPLIERFDYYTEPSHPSPYFLILQWFMMTFAAIGLPVILIGIALPWALDEQKTPRRWGILYGLNAFCAILGAITAGWILLPTIGFARTAWLGGILLVLASLFIMPNKLRLSVIPISILALIVAVMFESGIGRYRIQESFYARNNIKPTEILAFYEGPDATISAVEYDNGERLLIIDGFVTTAQTEQEINTDPAHYMVWMGHLPMLMHPAPKKALVICFGTGQTSNAVRNENPEKLDIVDLNKRVFDMAPIFTANENVLEDPRVTPIHMDGRAYIRRTEETYDVITLEPMPPNFAGTNALYSKEFYETAKSKMSENGMIAQWAPFHLISLKASKSISKTFQEVFPNSILWLDPVSQTGILVGSKNEKLDLAHSLPGYLREGIKRNLTREQVINGMALDPEQLRAFAGDAKVVTDNNQLLAYGRLLYESHSNRTLMDDNMKRIDQLQSAEE
jgi:spermidine synthase